MSHRPKLQCQNVDAKTLILLCAVMHISIHWWWKKHPNFLKHFIIIFVHCFNKILCELVFFSRNKTLCTNENRLLYRKLKQNSIYNVLTKVFFSVCLLPLKEKQFTERSLFPFSMEATGFLMLTVYTGSADIFLLQ